MWPSLCANRTMHYWNGNKKIHTTTTITTAKVSHENCFKYLLANFVFYLIKVIDINVKRKKSAIHADIHSTNAKESLAIAYCCSYTWKVFCARPPEHLRLHFYLSCVINATFYKIYVEVMQLPSFPAIIKAICFEETNDEWQ